MLIRLFYSFRNYNFETFGLHLISIYLRCTTNENDLRLLFTLDPLISNFILCNNIKRKIDDSFSEML